MDTKPPSGNASRAHADFGLLTIAPAASVAALELCDPSSGAWCTPEATLAPCEWLVFCGQAMSFLTAGELPAPIHRVPRIRCAAAPGGVRCSAPHFVRPAPSAELAPLRGATPPVTFREFVTEHTIALRPWANMRAVGHVGESKDW